MAAGFIQILAKGGNDVILTYPLSMDPNDPNWGPIKPEELKGGGIHPKPNRSQVNQEAYEYEKNNGETFVKPDYSFYNTVYHKYHPFSIETIRHNFKDGIGFGRKMTCELIPKGHMINKIYYYFKLPALSIPAGSTYVGWTNNIGHAIANSIEMKINGFPQVIKIYDIYQDAIYDLTTPIDKQKTSNVSLGKFEFIEDLETNAINTTSYLVELDVWFGRSLNKSLPICNMYAQNIEFLFDMKKFNELVIYDGTIAPTAVSIKDAAIYAKHVYLDDYELNLFSKKYITEYMMIQDPITKQYSQTEVYKNDEYGRQIPYIHKYLIDQVQYSEKLQLSANTTIYKADLKSFKFSVFELIFMFKELESDENNDWFNYSIRSNNTPFVDDITLTLEGHEFFKPIPEMFFRTNNDYHTHGTNRNIYNISFSKNPEDYDQPGGALNLSIIDNKYINFNMNFNNPACNLYVFARSYNEFKLVGGIPSLSFLT